MKCLWTSLALFMLLAPTGAEERFRTRLSADLNGDGKPEVIRLLQYRAGGVILGQLVVEDSGGKVLWRGPRSADPYPQKFEPFQFLGEFDGGDLVFVEDYDGDGKVDLVSTDQKSDVRPTVYRLFHWNGQKFLFDRRANLVPQPQKPATYNWAANNPARSVWAERIESVDGKYRLSITDLGHPEASAMLTRWQSGEGFVFTADQGSR